MARKKRSYVMTEETRQLKREQALAAAERRWKEPKVELGPVVPVEGDGLLYAMRFALKNSWHHDKSQLHLSLIKAARKMLKDDPLKFNDKLTELEREEKAPPVVEVDLGEEAALRVLDRLLASRPGVSHVGTGGMAQVGAAGVLGQSGIPEVADRVLP